MTHPHADSIGPRRAAQGSTRAPRTLVAVAQLLLLACTLLLPGCGDIEWFPPYVRLGTTPDQFTFAAKTGTDKSVTVTSEEITVSGLTASSSPISVTGSSGSESKYSINGAAATSAPGTVKNNDKVKVSHTSAATLGTTTRTTLTIGNVSADFVSTTRFVETPVFTAIPNEGASYRVMATLVAADGAPGTHVISIKDSGNSTGVQFSLSDNDIPTFYSNSQTVAFLNNRRIFVRNLTSSVDAGATTTLTIDGADFTVNMKP